MWVHVLNKKGKKSSDSFVVRGKATAGFLVRDVEGSGGTLADNKTSTEVGYHTEVFDDQHPEDGIHHHVVPETKQDGDGATIVVGVGRLVPK